MTLYLIGLGIWDEKDISVKGIETAKKCKHVFLENYTSVMMGSTPEKISKLIGKKVDVLDREAVEQKKDYLKLAKKEDVALLIGGDPSVATTHIEIIQEAKKQKIKTQVIHSSSISSAICESGLFNYSFGKSCSIPFWDDKFKPESFYDIIVENMKNNAHTLVFLDLHPEAKKFMTVNDALRVLLEIAAKRKKEINLDTVAVGFARIGSKDQVIKAGTISELLDFGFGAPMHILVIPGKLHFMEKEALNLS
jgi:diphthine synthase